FLDLGGPESAQVRKWILEEKKEGIDKINFYENFSGKVGNLKSSLKNLILSLKKTGKRIAAYGASAKGCTLLNYAGIGKESIDFIVDRNPHKQGLRMPGVNLEVFPPGKLLQVRPDFVLLLAWNFQKEILKQQARFRKQGGKFIIPIPEVAIV
ncbi:MAG: methyltransferase, partial [Candidatus Omnitrophica bacterium]|nr:methyltransferase [Candidatus Omnitrophota bacterium]